MGAGEAPETHMDAKPIRTPLYDTHVSLGAKMVPFAGYLMPVHYPGGIRAEHNAVRTTAGLFDVSHMGEFTVRGPQAADLIQYLTVNDASRIAVGQAQYSAICNEGGFVLDDLLVYRFEDRFLLVVNAGNRAKDWEWMNEHAKGFDVELTDDSDEIALLALQGPRSRDVLARLTGTALGAIGYYRFAEGTVAGEEAVLSRTGYTGEDGFELYLPAERAPAVWQALTVAGEPHGLVPAGLGARDSLRLEMGYALYGSDLDEAHTALESGLSWIVKLNAGDFIGQQALAADKERKPTRRLVGIRLLGRGFPRSGYSIVCEGRDVGVVTSGVASPTLGVGVALGYVPASVAAPGTEVGVRIRGVVVPGRTERPPFYTRGSIKR